MQGKTREKASLPKATKKMPPPTHFRPFFPKLDRGPTLANIINYRPLKSQFAKCHIIYYHGIVKNVSIEQFLLWSTVTFRVSTVTFCVTTVAWLAAAVFYISILSCFCCRPLFSQKHLNLPLSVVKSE